MIKLYKTNPDIPFERCYPNDSGIDLYANIDKELLLPCGERILIPTGIHIKLEQEPVINIGGVKFYYEAQVRPKSGLSFKQGLTVLNTPGTVDASYTGEIQVILYNSNSKLSENTILIKPMQKIAQLVFNLIVIPEIEQVSSLNDFESTDRNVNGFGSTGI